MDARGALIAATEEMLIESGYAAITVRSVAARAGVNHGLVHYYFSSLHELLLQTLEQFTERLIERQAQMYAGLARSSTSGARRCVSSTRTPIPAIRRSGSSFRP